MYKLQKSCAATSSENSIDAFVTHSHRPPPPFFFCLVSLVIQCERSGGYQSHRCLLQTSKPGALVHPSAPIIISARPLRKPRALEEKYLISSLSQGSTVTQTIGGSEEKEVGLEEGGGGHGEVRKSIKEIKQKRHLTSESQSPLQCWTLFHSDFNAQLIFTNSENIPS